MRATAIEGSVLVCHTYDAKQFIRWSGVLQLDRKGGTVMVSILRGFPTRARAEANTSP